MWENKFKFRVFDLENKLYLPSRDNQVFYYKNNWLGIDWFIRQSEKMDGIFKLYQYSGFQDRNASLIFEGDFLLYKASEEIRMQSEKKATATVKNTKISLVTRSAYGFNLHSSYDMPLSNVEWFSDLKVIGNIETSLEMVSVGKAEVVCKKGAEKYYNKNFLSLIAGLTDQDLELYLNSITRAREDHFRSFATETLMEKA